MAFFDTNYKTEVTAGVTRILADADVESAIPAVLYLSIKYNEGIPESLKRNILTGTVSCFKKYKRFGEKAAYTPGLPLVYTINETLSLTYIEDAIYSDTGETVTTLQSVYVDVVSIQDSIEYHLQENYWYNINNGTIRISPFALVDLRYYDGYTVVSADEFTINHHYDKTHIDTDSYTYTNSRVVSEVTYFQDYVYDVYNYQEFPSEDTYSVEQSHSTSGSEYDTPCAGCPDVGWTLYSGPTLVSNASVGTTVAYPDTFNISGIISTNQYYYVVRYVYAGQFRIWRYLLNSGVHPDLDEELSPTELVIDSGKYPPIVAVKEAGVYYTVAGNPTKFAEAEPLLKVLNLELEPLLDDIKTSIDTADASAFDKIKDMYFFLGANIFNTDMMFIKYFWHFFDSLPKPGISISTLETSIASDGFIYPIHSYHIVEGNFNYKIKYNTIYKETISWTGTTGDFTIFITEDFSLDIPYVDESSAYTSGYYETSGEYTHGTYTFTKEYRDGEPANFYIAKRPGIIVIYNQISSTQAERITIYGYKAAYVVYKAATIEALEYTPGLSKPVDADEEASFGSLIPINFSILFTNFNNHDQELILLKSFHIYYGAWVTYASKWYQQTWFHDLVTIATFLYGAYGLQGSLAAEQAAAISTGTTLTEEAATKFLVQEFVSSVIIQTVLVKALDFGLSRTNNKFLMAIYKAAYVASAIYFGSKGKLDLLSFKNIVNTTKLIITAEEAEITKEMELEEDRNKDALAKNIAFQEQIDKIYEMLPQSNLLTETILADTVAIRETPNELYDRIFITAEVIDIFYNQIKDRAALMLSLPEPTTIEVIYDG